MGSQVICSVYELSRNMLDTHLLTTSKVKTHVEQSQFSSNEPSKNHVFRASLANITIHKYLPFKTLSFS